MLSTISVNAPTVVLSPIDTEEPNTELGPISQFSPIDNGPCK